jgi:hypothetical protein
MAELPFETDDVLARRLCAVESELRDRGMLTLATEVADRVARREAETQAADVEAGATPVYTSHCLSLVLSMRSGVWAEAPQAGPPASLGQCRKNNVHVRVPGAGGCQWFDGDRTMCDREARPEGPANSVSLRRGGTAVVAGDLRAVSALRQRQKHPHRDPLRAYNVCVPKSGAAVLPTPDPWQPKG